MESATVSVVLWERVLAAVRRRWFQVMVKTRKVSAPPGFFDAYPAFFASSEIGAEPDRLNRRYRALIQSQRDAIEGKRVLDIASHDGRWSFAAHKCGASHVLGIEARPNLVEAARRNMQTYGADNVEFRQGDVFVELDRAEPVDTVLCFGFLYHTIDHMVLLRKIAALHPRDLILDTGISLLPGKLVEVSTEGTEYESEGAIADPGTRSQHVIGRPTKGALEVMLQACGFCRFQYYDWRNQGIRRWDDLEAYYIGRRITLRASV